MAKRKVSMRIDETLLQHLDAEIDERSRTRVVEQLVAEWLHRRALLYARESIHEAQYDEAEREG